MKGLFRKSGPLLGLLSLSVVLINLTSLHPGSNPAARPLLQQSNPQLTVLGRVKYSQEIPLGVAGIRVLINRQIQPLEGQGGTQGNPASDAQGLFQAGFAAVFSRWKVRKHPRRIGKSNPAFAPESFIGVSQWNISL